MTIGYVLRAVAGVLIAAASVVIASITIYHLVRTGSCASGGPYLSARPCPEGTGLRILALIGSIFVLAPLSVIVFGLRTKGMVGVPSIGGLIGLLWTFGWIAMGSAAWVAGHGPGAPIDGGEGATAVAITFWGIGGLSLALLIVGFVAAAPTARKIAQRAQTTSIPSATPAPAPRPTATPPPDRNVATPVRRMQQLDELKALGAVTDAEYDAKRREILGEI